MSVYQKLSSRSRLLPLLALIVLLVATYWSIACRSGVSRAQSNTANNAPVVSGGVRTSYADIVDRVAPSVVAVRSERRVRAAQQQPFLDDEFFHQFFGQRAPSQQQPHAEVERGIGSGVIVNSDGTILTNFHVVDGAEDIRVDLNDKRSFSARVIGTDKPSDLAVLKIDAANLPALQLGDSDHTRVGDVVLAIGNPLGLDQTVTMGIISAKGRATGISDGSFEDFLQTDAPINRGNSGGALVNTNAELVGINSQILSPSGGSIGIGFAIPTNMAKNIMSQLMQGGSVHRGQLGIGIQTVTSAMAESLGLKDVRGVIVNQVTPGSPAEKAGVKQGDLITTFDGMIVTDANELRNKVAGTLPGSQATLGILRDGKETEFKVSLGEFKGADAAGLGRDGADDGANSGGLGVTVQPITPDLAQQLGVPATTQGLAVTAVNPGGPADDAGVEPGDVIVQINRQVVRDVGQVKSALQLSGAKPALLLINRRGRTLFVTVAK